MPATQDSDRRTPKVLPAFLLLLLAEGDKYGGELVAALKHISESLSLDRGAVYRCLRDLEEAEQVASRWEPGSAAPPRRIYQMTAAGWEALAAWDREVAARRRNLARFARRYRLLLQSRTRTGPAAGRKEARP
ncbi:MAG: PadR family transcriptional regulator [Symbiobacteriia bacterium]